MIFITAWKYRFALAQSTEHLTSTRGQHGQTIKSPLCRFFFILNAVRVHPDMTQVNVTSITSPIEQPNISRTTGLGGSTF